MLVFMKATDACILVGKVEFILGHSQVIFCKSNVFDNFSQVTLAPQRVRGVEAFHPYAVCMLYSEDTDMISIQAQSQKSFLFPSLSLPHSRTFIIWYPHWSLIAMATSDFSCSLGPCCHYPIRTRPLLRFPQAPLIQLTMMN